MQNQENDQRNPPFLYRSILNKKKEPAYEIINLLKFETIAKRLEMTEKQDWKENKMVMIFLHFLLNHILKDKRVPNN